MTEVEQLARYVCTRGFKQISQEARRQLKIRILDALGCGIAALGADLISKLHIHLEDVGGQNLISLLGGKKGSLEHGTFFNTALIRYLDFNDAYLAKEETCHPSDNVAAILAAAEYVDGSGEDLLVALAVMYQVQCRLSDEAPPCARRVLIIQPKAPTLLPQEWPGLLD